jgi:hypothetical protein
MLARLFRLWRATLCTFNYHQIVYKQRVWRALVFGAHVNCCVEHARAQLSYTAQIKIDPLIIIISFSIHIYLFI